MEGIIEIIKQPWPWYVAGPLIGLMVPLLLLSDNKQFGVSSTFRDFCAIVLPGRKNSYFNYSIKEHLWRNLFVLGILIGGIFCGLFLDNGKNIGISEKTIYDLNSYGINDFSGLSPANIYSWSGLCTLKGCLFIVLGGLLVGFGTRYADGCTSGHAITGLSNLEIPSLIAVIGFFIGGLIMTWLLLPLIF